MKTILLSVFLITTGFFTSAQPVVGFSSFIDAGLTATVDIVNAKDNSNRLFFVQQNGIIRVYSGSALLPANFLDVSNIVLYETGGERGLLSLVFHPGYATNRYFFIYYNNKAGNLVLAQYQTSATNPNVADPASGKVLLTIIKPPYPNHNGCKLNFGIDGNLYFATGDGGSGGDPLNNAQNPASLLGKMIRINVDDFTDATEPYYTVPATNPFVGVAGYAPEIYAVGLRNPWRWSFDRLNNDMWLADVGQGAWEEVNHLPLTQTSGVNYGWRCYESAHEYAPAGCGPTALPGRIRPIFEYPHNNGFGGFSITGGYVYRGTEFPALQGYYICCDYVTTNGWLVRPDGNGAATALQQNNFPVHTSCFGEAEDGTLYAGSLDGPVYKVNLTSILPVRLLSFNGRFSNGSDLLEWTTTIDPSLSRFEIEQSDDGTRFQKAGSQLAKNTGTTAAYTFSASPGTVATRFYRIKMIYADGKVQYSSIVKIGSSQLQQITVSYNGVRQIQLSTPYDLKSVTVVDLTGHKIADYSNVKTGNHLLNAGVISTGMYVVNCIGEDGRRQQVKIMIQ